VSVCLNVEIRLSHSCELVMEISAKNSRHLRNCLKSDNSNKLYVGIYEKHEHFGFLRYRCYHGYPLSIRGLRVVGVHYVTGMGALLIFNYMKAYMLVDTQIQVGRKLIRILSMTKPSVF
jgi:hypothetical protein